MRENLHIFSIAHFKRNYRSAIKVSDFLHEKCLQIVLIDVEGQRFPIRLTFTKQKLQGYRRWFLCPECGKRCAVLRLRSRGPACNECIGYKQPSKQEAVGMRGFVRVERLRKRLGWKPGIAHGLGHKPKGMHWRRACK